MVNKYPNIVLFHNFSKTALKIEAKGSSKDETPCPNLDHKILEEIILVYFILKLNQKLTVGTYSEGNLLVVYEISRHVLPTAPSPTTTHLIVCIAKKIGSIPDQIVIFFLLFVLFSVNVINTSSSFFSSFFACVYLEF